MKNFLRFLSVICIILFIIRGNSAFDNAETSAKEYNATYPITPPLKGRPGVVTYRIAMIADLDSEAGIDNGNGKCTDAWHSYLKTGYLSHSRSNDKIQFKWDAEEPKELSSGYSIKGRGMELSELVTFDGKLLSFDDRTGLVFDLSDNSTDKPIPWIILIDGNGRKVKGFKAEWGTVKDRKLYVGSTGTEWVNSKGEVVSKDALYVKVISADGLVKSVDWSENFRKIRSVADQITWPGYMTHESGVWSDVHRKWFFLPRRCSHEGYDPTRDEYMGCNLLISSDETFTFIDAVRIDIDAETYQSTHGFSSFKFVPGTEDRIIVALKTEELNDKTTTFITAFDIHGAIIFAQQHIETDLKYEGFEFI